jgi:alanyl-tRNA synthetase
LQGSFLHQLSGCVVDVMKPFYPELEPSREFIAKVIAMEEERFNRTLANGLKMFDDLLQAALANQQELLAGADLFRLSDTYGFPLDFARDLAMEKGVGVDSAGFQRALEDQKERSRLSLQEKRRETVTLEGVERLRSEFTGYDELQSDAVLLAIYANGRKTERLAAGEKGILVFDRTPFYAEGGGQVGDSGSLRTADAYVAVSDARKAPGGAILHEAQGIEGSLRVGDGVRLEVDAARRRQIAVHHTSTHMLHAALREVLGLHVKQAGSRVGPDKLRFDFTHFSSLSAEELERVELAVNEKIRENIPVARRTERYEDALRSGAMAIFEEKYGDTVRVVSVPGFSMELCGGTHCRATGDIGPFVIVQEGGIAANVRRIEALTGLGALRHLQDQHDALAGVLARLNVGPAQAGEAIDRLHAEVKRLGREIAQVKMKAATATTAGSGAQVVQVGDARLLTRRVDDLDASALRDLADSLKNELGRGVVVLGASAGDKVQFVISVTPDLAGRVHAGKLVKELAPIVGGGGGGRPDFAQAGGRHPDKLDDLLAASREAVARMLGS